MAELSIKEKKIEKILRIDKESFTIGRSPENDLVLDDPVVSSRHCVIQLVGGDVKLVDLNSSNGTIVDGKRIEGSFPLNDGGRIEIGSARLRFFSETATVPRFIVAGPDMEGTTLILGKETLAVGRMASNDLVLSHSGVSNFHVQIAPTNEGYRIQDLGSTNGTIVNGDFVTVLTLSKGDRVEIGPYTLTFHGIREAPLPGPAAVSARIRTRTAGARSVTAAAVIAGILVFLVLVEVIARRLSGSADRGTESGFNLLIGNVSFENAIGQERTPPGWRVEADAHSIARLTQNVAHSGTACLEIETDQEAAMDSVVSCVYAEDIPVDRTRGYKGTFWVQTQNRSGLCLASLEWVDMPSGQIVGEDFGRAVAECRKWTCVTVGGIPAEEADRVRLRFVTYGGKGILRVDDAALYEVPSGEVRTVRYKAVMGDCRVTMDSRGLLSLRLEDVILIMRSEFVVDMGGVETGQPFSALAAGYPVMDENGFTVRGKLLNPASSQWIKFESVVSALDASVNLNCRVWPEKGGANPTELRLDLFIPLSVIREGGLRTITEGKAIVRESAFVAGNIDRIEMGLSEKVISMRVSSFDKVTLENAGRRGLKLMLTKRVRGVSAGGSVDVSLGITPN